MNLIKSLLIIVLLTASHHALAGERPTVTQAQLVSLQAAPKAEPFTLLDVRSAGEYSSGHIQGALNISHAELSDKLNLLPQNKDELVVVYCRSGRRASIAEQLLREQGYTRVRHLAGDMNAWSANNLPVTSSK